MTRWKRPLFELKRSLPLSFTTLSWCVYKDPLEITWIELSITITTVSFLDRPSFNSNWFFKIISFRSIPCFLALQSFFLTSRITLYALAQWGDFSDEIICFPSLVLKSSQEPSSMKGNCAMYFEDHWKEKDRYVFLFSAYIMCFLETKFKRFLL